MRKLATAVTVGCTAALAWAGTALAATPERFDLDSSGSEPGFIHCDGYDIDLDTTGGEIFRLTSTAPARSSRCSCGRDSGMSSPTP